MKISVVASLCILLSTTTSSVSAWGFGSSSSSKQAEEAEVEVNNTEPTSVNSRSLKTIIHEERRFVLFNSRRLSGECLPICSEPEPTNKPTFPPVAEAQTLIPTSPERTARPTDPPTLEPTKDPSASPTKATATPTLSPTDIPTATPTKAPTVQPTPEPTPNPTPNPTNAPTVSPTKNPTNAPTANPTVRETVPPPPPTGGGLLDCEQLQDLGYGFSKAIGPNHYNGKCFPPVTGLQANNLPGRDDSIAVFVGGNYHGQNAAEVEGNMVVLGNLQVDSNGPGNFVSVGAGTHVLPNVGGECIKVGGKLTASRNIQVFNQANSMNCDIVYKGSQSGKNKWKTNGEVRYDPDLDLSEYENMVPIWKRKSEYWSTLPTTGTVKLQWGGTTFQCSSGNGYEGRGIEIFRVLPNERNKIENIHTIYFSDSCEGKTILINVQGSGNRAVDAAAMHFKGKSGHGSGGFSTCLTSSILWNFPDAATVNLGNGRTSEFHGSLLVTGNLDATTTGYSGRTVVLGNLVHNKGGSEFHSYDFNPPFPLPDPDDICEYDGTISFPGSSNGAQEAPPTVKPTVKPTNPPVPSGCKAKKNNGVGVTDSACAACKNGQTWWPCDMNPPMCEGTGCCKSKNFKGPC